MTKLITLFIIVLSILLHINAQLGKDKGGNEITIGISGYPSGEYRIYKGETKYIEDYRIQGYDDKNGDGIGQAWAMLRKDDSPELDWISFDPNYNATEAMIPPQETDSSTRFGIWSYVFPLYANADQLKVGESYGFGVRACDELPDANFGARACVETSVGYAYLTVDPYPIELVSCRAIKGTSSKVYIDWTAPQNLNWNLDHYKIYQHKIDSIEYATLADADLIKENIPNHITSIYINNASRSVSPYYTVVGYDSLGEAVAISKSVQPSYEKNSFSLLSPKDGKVIKSLTPDFDWEDYGSGIYELIYGTDSTFTNATVISNISTSEYTLTASLLDYTEYFWKVRTNDGIETNETGWSFSTNLNDVVPTTFDLTTPINGAIIDSYLKSFEWEISSDPGDSLFYRIQISETSDFSVVAVDKITENNYYHTLYEFNEGTTYYWKVFANDTEGNIVESTNHFPFSVQINERPTDFRLLNPKFNEGGLPTETSLLPTLTWENSTDPESEGNIIYTLWYSTDKTFEQKTVIDNINTNSYTITTNLEEDARYYWKVKAEDHSGLIKWNNGNAYTFVTNNSDRDPAQAPLILPLEDIPYADNNVEFKWESPEDDIYDLHEYELWYSTDPNFNSNNTTVTLFADTVYQVPQLAYGTYYWKIITNTYLLPVTGDGSGLFIQGASSESEVKSFVVSPIYITALTSPNGGELWPVGTSQTISWTSNGIESLKIEYSNNGGISWNLITIITDPSIQNYSWEVPDDISTNCLVRIVDQAGFAGSDVSDNTFTIEPYSVIHVSPFGNDISGNGSKELPYASIQTALDNVTGRGDSIKVLGGNTYSVFNLPTNVGIIEIVGGYTENFSSRNLSNKSIVDCEGANALTQLPSNRVIDGFLFTDFNNAIDHSGSPSPWNIYFKNCEFINGNEFGGIYAAGSISFINCLFKDITVDGMWMRQPRDINLINCVFINVASPGFYLFGIVGTITVKNTNFINCGTGLQLADWYKKSYYITNSLFVGCGTGFAFYTSSSGGYSVLDIRKNNFYDNTSNANITLDASNLYIAPNFIDSINHDYRLANHSQLIGQGDINTASEYDYDNNPRPSPAGSNPDIGAFENPASEPFAGIYVNTKVLLEGCYNSSSLNTELNTNSLLPLNSNTAYDETEYNYVSQTVSEIPTNTIVDWVLIELRTEPNQPTSNRVPAFLLSNGKVVNRFNYGPVAFPGLSSGDYYTVIYHRNHLPIMSANAISLSLNSPLYDFTTGQEKAYGSNPMKELDTDIYGMAAGDADHNGSVDYSNDLLGLWLPNFGLNEYHGADMNMNGTIDYGNDLLGDWLPNFGLTTGVPNSSGSSIDWNDEANRIKNYLIKQKQKDKN